MFVYSCFYTFLNFPRLLCKLALQTSQKCKTKIKCAYFKKASRTSLLQECKTRSESARQMYALSKLCANQNPTYLPNFQLVIF